MEGFILLSQRFDRKVEKLEPATRIERSNLSSVRPESLPHRFLRRGPTPLYDLHEGDTSPSNPLSSLLLIIGSAPGCFAIWSRRLESNQRPAVYEWREEGFSSAICSRE